MTESCRLNRQQRLRKGTDFRRCYDHGVRSGNSHLLIFGRPNNLEFSRVGVSVSKRHGNAVRRNRKKRLLKEAFRLLQHQLPAGIDLVLVPRQRPDSGLVDFQDSLLRLLAEITRKMNRNSQARRRTGDVS